MKKLDQSQIILVVEDSDDDYEVITEAFAEDSNFKNPVVRCEDGRMALKYLYREEPYNDPERWPLPGIIMLDLNLPGIDGRSVLQRLKHDPELHKIPVIVLTTSSDSKDIEECYNFGANSYIQKPVDLEKFIIAIQRLKEYWFEISILPKE